MFLERHFVLFGGYSECFRNAFNGPFFYGACRDCLEWACQVNKILNMFFCVRDI